MSGWCKKRKIEQLKDTERHISLVRHNRARGLLAKIPWDFSYGTASAPAKIITRGFKDCEI